MPIRKRAMAAIRGVTVLWALFASCVLGVWLMFSRVIFGTKGAIADSDHLAGALIIITVAVCAMAEVARPLRFVNLLFGLWLIVAPWMLGGSTVGTNLNGVVVGILVIGLSLPRAAEQRTLRYLGPTCGLGLNDTA